MYYEFDQICFVGMSNSELFHAEKDPRAIEFKFMLRPNLEFPGGSTIAGPKDLDELHRREGDEEVKEDKSTVSSVELKLHSLGEIKVEDDDDDGFRTPTSVNHKIAVTRQCPPAPRKPKSLPLKKRKAPSKLSLLRIDLSKEIESLFPPSLLSDLGSKIKKVRGGYTK